MNDTNSEILIGRLTRDLGENDMVYLSGSGTARANISIAVNRSRKQGDQWVDEVKYFDITVWGKTAENLKPYLLKGKQVCVKGFLKQDRWEKDGQKYSKVHVIAEDVQLLGGKNDGTASGGNGYGGASYSQPKQTYTQPQAQNFAPPPADEGFPEDLPF